MPTFVPSASLGMEEARGGIWVARVCFVRNFPSQAKWVVFLVASFEKQEEGEYP